MTTVHVSGGGARDRRWLQLLADVFGRPVRVDFTPDIAPRGAALLAAAAAAGVDIASLRRDPVGETLLPGSAAGMYADLYADSLELYPHLSQLSAVPECRPRVPHATTREIERIPKCSKLVRCKSRPQVPPSSG